MAQLTPPISDQIRARILELDQEGWYGKDIAVEVGVSPSGVSRVLRNYRPQLGTQRWKAHAACDWRELPWHDPFKAKRGELAAMLATCATCPVRDECAEDLRLTKDRVGVRAGVVWSYAEYPHRAKPAEVKRCACGDLYAVRSNQQAHCSDLCRQRGAA